MVEEVKLSFKGKWGENTNPLDLFVGLVSSISNDKDNTIIFLEGRDLINETTCSLSITNKKEINFEGIHAVKDLHHMVVGDILVVTGSKIRSLFRAENPNNSIFATVRCNSNCLMCSQPPLDYDDTIESINIWMNAIDLMPRDLKFIGITGGEPTLLGNGLVLIVNKLLNNYPDLIIDILSNGRLQATDGLNNILSKITNPERVVFAIPLYSDIYKEHDYIVQAKDAFFQTCVGIHKMAELGFAIEIRIVLHKLSIGRLRQLSEFIHYNFPFSYHITFMGLEIIGYTKMNKDILIIDNQIDYVDDLKGALEYLDKWKYNVSIYNTPLCHLPDTLWHYAKKSISDWKNSFHDECDNCVLKNECSGFFSWNLPYSKVYPFKTKNEETLS